MSNFHKFENFTIFLLLLIFLTSFCCGQRKYFACYLFFKNLLNINKECPMCT